MKLGDLLKKVPGAADVEVYLHDPLGLDDWDTVHVFFTDGSRPELALVSADIKEALEESERTR